MPEYQLVLQLPSNIVPDFDAMVAIEDELIERLSGIAEVDGHDIGSGTINYFVLTTKPKQAFERAKSVFEMLLLEFVERQLIEYIFGQRSGSAVNSLFAPH